MSKIKNINRKQLKQPDQFVSFWTRLWSGAGEALVARRKPVLIGLGVLAGVVVATLVSTQFRERSAIRASQALARVEKIATAELLPADGTTKPGDTATPGIPRFKTDKERIEGALKEADALLDAERRGPLRDEALLQKAGFLLDLQRADEALAIYADLVARGVDKNLRFMAQEGLGYAYEAKGDLDKAAEAFGKLGEGAVVSAPANKDAPAPMGFYQDRALYHKARIAERKGNPTEAAKIYREVLEKSPMSQLRDDVSNRLATLEQK